MPITITPAYWQTLWFRGGIIGILLMLLAAGYFWRVRQLKGIQVNLEHQVNERISQLQLLAKKEQQNMIEKSQFLAMLTHELKSPLAAIELATKNIQRTKNPQITELSFKHIQSAAHDMSVITQRCLQADKLEQANSAINLSTFSLDWLVDDIVQTLDSETRLHVDILQPISITSDELLC